MEKIFNEEFKKDFLNMQRGEDWNNLKEKYNVDKYEWDKEMIEHFENLLKKYSNPEDYRKRRH